MTMTYATVSGRITKPGTAIGLRVRLTATPETTNTTLRFPDDALITFGPQVAETNDNGDIPAGFQVPLDSSFGEALIWRFTVEPLDNVPGLAKKWILGRLPVTGDVTIDEITIADVTAVTGDLADSVAENAAAVLDVVATNDGIMTAVAADSESDFAGALAATIADETGSPGTDKVVYVSKDGHDSHDGTAPKRAFLTLAAAMAALPSGGTIRMGWGTFDEANLSPADRTVVEGTSRLGTVIRLASNGTLMPLQDTVNCTFKHVGFTFATGVTGTLIELDNCFNNHFFDFTLYGTWAGSTEGAAQLGLHLTGNAGDNMFSDFVISNLGQGAQIDSQTNLFAAGKFSNCKVHFQGGDPTGVAFSSGAELKGVVFNGTGDVFINLNGTSQAWIFDDVWCDGLADKAIVIGNSTTHAGPALVVLGNLPNVAAKVKCIEVNSVGQIVIGPARFGAASGYTPTEMTIDATYAPSGFAFGLKSGQGFDMSTTFPAGWAYFPRGNSQTTQMGSNTLAFGGLAGAGSASYIQNLRFRAGYDGAGNVIVSDAGGGRPVGLRSGAGGAARTSVYADTDGQAVIAGGFRIPVMSPGTFPYTVLLTDVFVLVPTGTAKTVTLPSAATAKAGHQIIIKDSSGGGASFNITVNRAGSDTIEGATSKTINTAYGTLRLISNGVDTWYLL